MKRLHPILQELHSPPKQKVYCFYIHNTKHQREVLGPYQYFPLKNILHQEQQRRLLLELARIKKQEKKDHKLFTILFVMLALFALIFAGILALFTNSNAYKVAKAYLMHDEKLETQR